MSDDLQRKLEAWADQASPVSADEARTRAETGDIGALAPAGGGGGHGPGARRLLAVAAAVVLVGAVAVGGWFVTKDDDGGPTGVDTIDQPTTTIATDPSPSVDTEDPVTTTTFPDGTTSEAPKLIVVHSPDHKLEVFDRTTGSTVRVLAEFDDPEAEVADGEPAMMGRYLGPFVVSPDGQTVYYETCCEPAAGEIFQIPITGGEPELVTYGTDPAISPDGTKLAVVDPGGLLVIDLTDGSEQRYDPGDGQPVTLLANPAWSPIGSTVVLEQYDDSLDFGRVVLVTLDGSEGARREALTVALNDGAPMLPVFDGQGNTVVIRQRLSPEGFPELDPTQLARAETYRTEGASDGAFAFGDVIATVDLDGPVLSQVMTSRGSFLLRTFADGTLRADLGGGNTLEILDHGYLDAAW